MARSSDMAIEAEHPDNCDCSDCEAEEHQRYEEEPVEHNG